MLGLCPSVTSRLDIAGIADSTILPRLFQPVFCDASCGYGRTTAGPGVGRRASDCLVAPGYGLIDGRIGLCPAGEQLLPGMRTQC
jgi:hypothetical protein